MFVKSTPVFHYIEALDFYSQLRQFITISYGSSWFPIEMKGFGVDFSLQLKFYLASKKVKDNWTGGAYYPVHSLFTLNIGVGYKF